MTMPPSDSRRGSPRFIMPQATARTGGVLRQALRRVPAPRRRRRRRPHHRRAPHRAPWARRLRAHRGVGGGWMPDMQTTEAEALAKRVLAAPRRFKAATLGWRLGLTEGERAALGITTMRAAGVSDAEMTERRKAKASERAARWRERQPKKPRKVPLRESRPWEAFGISESTWRRRGKPMPVNPPAERDRKPRTQQVVLASTCCVRPFPSPSVARKAAVRRKITRPEPFFSLNPLFVPARERFGPHRWHDRYALRRLRPAFFPDPVARRQGRHVAPSAVRRKVERGTWTRPPDRPPCHSVG